MEIIKYNGKKYPKLQSEGFASQYAYSFANKFCSGKGYDIGCNRLEWCFNGAEPIDPELNEFDALNLPEKDVDYIFSSHCLEHVTDYVEVLDYWCNHLIEGGILLMYLPNMDYQEYWNPANNRKHIHYFNPMIIRSYFSNRTNMWGNVIVTDGYDLNGSFYVLAEKI